MRCLHSPKIHCIPRNSNHAHEVADLDPLTGQVYRLRRATLLIRRLLPCGVYEDIPNVPQNIFEQLLGGSESVQADRDGSTV